MAVAYGKVHEQFWSDEKVDTLSDRAKLLALYLITGPHRSALGAMRLPLGYLTADLGWSESAMTEALRELESIGFIVREWPTGWTLIRKFLKWDGPENPNQVVRLAKLCADLPKGGFRVVTIQTAWFWISRLDASRKLPFLKWLDSLDDGENPIAEGKGQGTVGGTVPKPSSNPDPDPGRGSGTSGEIESSTARASGGPPGGTPEVGKSIAEGRNPVRDPANGTAGAEPATAPMLLDWRAIQRQGAWFEAACKLIRATMPDREGYALIAGALAGRSDAKAAIERIWRAHQAAQRAQA